MVTLDILVAEDKESEFRETRKALEKIAAELDIVINVDWAENYVDAISKITTKDYDLLLLDINFKKSLRYPDKRGGFRIVENVNGSDKAAHYRGKMYFLSGEGWYVQWLARDYRIPFIKKVWFRREGWLSKILRHTQPEDARTYDKLKEVVRKHYQTNPVS